MATKRLIVNSAGVGLLGASTLFAFYFVILSWVGRDWRHPFAQLYPVRYWMVALLLGFGFQLGLFWYARSLARLKSVRNITVTSSSISTATMVACCAHHLTDLIPLLGLSAAAIFLAKYQTYFLAFAIISNLAGIYFVFKMMKKHRLIMATHI